MVYRPLVQLTMPCHVLPRRKKPYGLADEPVRGVVLHRSPGGPDERVLGAHHEHQYPSGGRGRPRPRAVEATRGDGAVSALVRGSVVLVREACMAVHVVQERAASIHAQVAPHEDPPA
jgi:hypothetical protein